MERFGRGWLLLAGRRIYPWSVCVHRALSPVQGDLYHCTYVMPRPWRNITDAGASQAGDQHLPPSTATGEVSPAPGTQVAVATRGPGYGPLHSTQRQSLALAPSALEPGRASLSLSPQPYTLLS